MSSADFDADSLNPSLPIKGKIHDWFIFAPLVLSFIGFFIPNTELLNAICIFTSAVATYYFVSKDRAMLLRANYDAPAQIWWLIIPVYIWKRTTVTNGNRQSFWLYVLLYSCIIALSWHQVNRTDETSIAESACNTVTKISVENDGVDSPVCLRVVLEDEVTTNNWKAIAQMDNGTTRHLGVSFNPENNDVSIKLSDYTGYFN